MIICPYRPIAVALLLGFADASAVRTGLNGAAYAHEDHQGFAAGEPGEPQKPARAIKVVMREDGKKMAFEPALVTVRKGEQIRFVLENTGIDDHEFVLATVKENRKHAALMKKFPIWSTMTRMQNVLRPAPMAKSYGNSQKVGHSSSRA
jgi:uncharacterized cupredoxin-like copper-binding protein